MEAILAMFRRFMVGGGRDDAVKSVDYPYYVAIDEAAWDKYREENNEATLRDFIANYGVKKMLCAGQNIPEGFIGVESGSTIKLRF